jgi:hypothetical protein
VDWAAFNAMISLHASEPAAPVKPHVDEMVSRVLDVAEFSYSQRNPNGSITHFWKLRKPVGGQPAGTVLPLARLHALIFK